MTADESQVNTEEQRRDVSREQRQPRCGPINVELDTAEGDRFVCVWWPSQYGSSKRIFVTAAGAGGGPGIGGSDGPYSLYRRLAHVLPEHFGVSVLQVVYHKFSDVPAAIADVAAAIDFCVAQGTAPGIAVASAKGRSTVGRDANVPAIVLLGWSMGCPAVIEAAALRPDAVHGIVTIGGQSKRAPSVARLPTRTAITILHGEKDDCIKPAAAELLYRKAGGPARPNLTLKIFRDAACSMAVDF